MGSGVQTGREKSGGVEVCGFLVLYVNIRPAAIVLGFDSEFPEAKNWDKPEILGEFTSWLVAAPKSSSRTDYDKNIYTLPTAAYIPVFGAMSTAPGHGSGSG